MSCCCYNLLTGNGGVYDIRNVVGLEMKFRHILLKVKGDFQHSCNVKMHAIILQTHFVE